MSKFRFWSISVILILILISFLLFATILYARITQSPVPRLSIIPDMDVQRKYLSQSENLMFVDNRAMRLPLDGTVEFAAPTNLQYRKGHDGDKWAIKPPTLLDLDQGLLELGEKQYNIYCAPCHGLDGSGSGIVDIRARRLQEPAWIPPTDYHGEELRSIPTGRLVSIITNGIRNMPAYGSQIPLHDRWAIALHVKLLQFSRSVDLNELDSKTAQCVLDDFMASQQTDAETDND